jgi:hypothetical protein
MGSMIVLFTVGLVFDIKIYKTETKSANSFISTSIM